MPRYNIKTTVDITVTNPTRDETDQIKVAQQGNFNSLVQGIGLRANIDWDTDPVLKEEDGEGTGTPGKAAGDALATRARPRAQKA